MKHPIRVSIRPFIDLINSLAEHYNYFDVCALAKDCLEIYQNNLDKLHPIARQAVEHYIEEGRD